VAPREITFKSRSIGFSLSMFYELSFAGSYVRPLQNLSASHVLPVPAGVIDPINDQSWPYSEMGVSWQKQLRFS